MTTFFRGAAVKQIVVPIEGKVVGFNVDQESGARLINVEYTDVDGNVQQRFFKEDELELKPE